MEAKRDTNITSKKLSKGIRGWVKVDEGVGGINGNLKNII